MKLRDIPPGSDLAYQQAVEIVREQILFELETCERMLGTDPQKVLKLIADEAIAEEKGELCGETKTDPATNV
jgi:hypothetical protein